MGSRDKVPSGWKGDFSLIDLVKAKVRSVAMYDAEASARLGFTGLAAVTETERGTRTLSSPVCPVHGDETAT